MVKRKFAQLSERYKVRKKYANFLRHIQIINDVSDVLHLFSGYKSALQSLIKKERELSINPYANKTVTLS